MIWDAHPLRVTTKDDITCLASFSITGSGFAYQDVFIYRCICILGFHTSQMALMLQDFSDQPTLAMTMSFCRILAFCNSKMTIYHESPFPACDCMCRCFFIEGWSTTFTHSFCRRILQTNDHQEFRFPVSTKE